MSPGPRFFTSRVLAAEPAGEGQVLLTVDAPPGYLDAHARAGQWCELRVPGAVAAPYALYSTPAERCLVFLVRLAGAPIAEVTVGDTLEIARPEGPGFDLARAEGRDVVFLATGTGIAPIRAAIETVLARRASYGALSLYYGVRDDRFVAVPDDLARWREAGVTVRVHASRPGTEAAARYVQHLVEEDAPDPTRTAFVAAGHPELVPALERYATSRGASESAVIDNH
jgi:ferredoxin-NADP reductase